MKKVFVVMDINSHFISVCSCYQKAKNIVERLGGEYLGNELIIEENSINDFSMFDPI